MLTPQEKATILFLYALALLEHQRELGHGSYTVSGSAKEMFDLFSDKILKL